MTKPNQRTIGAALLHMRAGRFTAGLTRAYQRTKSFIREVSSCHGHRTLSYAGCLATLRTGCFFAMRSLIAGRASDLNSLN